LALAEEGCDVAINYSRSQQEAEMVAEEIQERGRRALPVQADVSDDAAVRRMIDEIASTLGGLDILINNAGITRYVPLEDLEGVTNELWDRVLAVNLRGPFCCVRAALPYLRRSGRGKVINTASNSAFRAMGSSIPYMISKAGLVTLTQVLAKALAPHVQVNAIAPGWLETTWGEHYLPSDVRQKAQQRATPASLEDVATSVVYLATTDSVTGETIIIDRGDSL
jgi:3-oxoacyl-[acyl-carrier protein] reductase